MQYPKVAIKLKGKVNICDNTYPKILFITSWVCYAEIAPVLVDQFPKGFPFQMTFVFLKEFAA